MPSNIAEGSKRRQAKDYAHFLNMALSSLAEAEYFVILAQDLGYLPQEETDPIFVEMDHIGRMLNSLQARVEQEASRRGPGRPAKPAASTDH